MFFVANMLWLKAAVRDDLQSKFLVLDQELLVESGRDTPTEVLASDCANF